MDPRAAKTVRWEVSGLGLLSHGLVSHRGVTVGAGKAQHSGAAGGFGGGLPPSHSATWWHLAWANNPGHRESRDWKEDEGAPLFVVAVSTAAQRGQDGGTRAARWGVGPRRTAACDQTRMARPGFGCRQRGGAGKGGASCRRERTNSSGDLVALSGTFTRGAHATSPPPPGAKPGFKPGKIQ